MIISKTQKAPKMKNFYLLTLIGLFSFNSVFSSPVPGNTSTDALQLVTNLYAMASGGSPVLVDGTLTQYSTNYSNNLDSYDARKMTNPGENWGMLRNNAVYIVERRRVIEGQDSVFFKMWNMREINYRLELITNNLNFPGRTGILEDKYLKTSTPISLNGNTEIDFAITNDAASAATDRFRIIFSNVTPKGLLPVDFVYSNAVQNNQFVDLTWKAENAAQANIFSIQKSTDGIHFQSTNSVKAGNTDNNQYRFTDETPANGENYYRICSVDNTGKIIMSSNIMKVNVAIGLEGISIYPNPATSGNLNLRIGNQQSGEYNVRLLNSFGQNFMDKKIQYNGGTIIQKIQPSQKIPPGIYQLEIKSQDGKSKTLSVVF